MKFVEAGFSLIKNLAGSTSNNCPCLDDLWHSKFLNAKQFKEIKKRVDQLTEKQHHHIQTQMDDAGVYKECEEDEFEINKKS